MAWHNVLGDRGLVSLNMKRMLSTAIATAPSANERQRTRAFSTVKRAAEGRDWTRCCTLTF